MRRSVQLRPSYMQLYVQLLPSRRIFLILVLEGIMLTRAFTAVTVSYLTGSWVLGILISMVGRASHLL